MDLNDLIELIRYTKAIENKQKTEQIPKIDYGKHELIRAVLTPLLNTAFIEERLEELKAIEVEWVKQ
jgi:hypothetical protein